MENVTDSGLITLGTGPDYHQWGPKVPNILRAHYGAAYVEIAAKFVSESCLLFSF